MAVDAAAVESRPPVIHPKTIAFKFLSSMLFFSILGLSRPRPSLVTLRWQRASDRGVPVLTQPRVVQVPLGGWDWAAQCVACLWKAFHEEVTCPRITEEE